jgi:3-phosphoshikimate 1-carboxyvinyltransferase
LYWFDKVGLKYENHGYKRYHFPGNKPPKVFDTEIPYEWSAPGYPLLAAMISPNSEISVQGMDLSDPYGDRQVLEVFRKMRADLIITDSKITARTSKLQAVEVDMNSMPDQVPTVAIAACYAKGRTTIKNILTARWKECDRITAVCTELKKMGAKVEEGKDYIVIDQDGSWQLKGADLNGYYDHRMVLAFAVAAMQAEGKTTITDAQMMDKSFGNFYPQMKKAGAKMVLQ